MGKVSRKQPEIFASATERLRSAGSNRPSRGAGVSRGAAVLPARVAGLLGGRRPGGPFRPVPRRWAREDELVTLVQRRRWGRGERLRVRIRLRIADRSRGVLATANAPARSSRPFPRRPWSWRRGDRPAFTFVATVNAVCSCTPPGFVDTDVDTLQIDARTANRDPPRTRRDPCTSSDRGRLDTILQVASRPASPSSRTPSGAPRRWRGRSRQLRQHRLLQFQAANSLPRRGGDPTSDQTLLEACSGFTNTEPPGGAERTSLFATGANLRPPIPGPLLLAQMSRLEAQSKTREQNAAYLTKRLAEIPGITPARMYDGCTRNAWHLYMFRYDANQFSGLPRALFLKALTAEGVPVSGGYSPLNTQPFLEETFGTRGYKRFTRRDSSRRGGSIATPSPQNDRLFSRKPSVPQTSCTAAGDVRPPRQPHRRAVLKVRRTGQ